ncbi:MAG: hypothetical protein PHW75_02640 [Patescibacteria group bacterium]|nr:hypothetical protein [Patescibacteria group bacterium]
MSRSSGERLATATKRLLQLASIEVRFENLGSKYPLELIREAITCSELTCSEAARMLSGKYGLPVTRQNVWYWRERAG